ncbi:MAG: DNA replication/repair protein RecF, partial [Gammaproteobacteria bacterium]|nr:DNA replication/repair protein RecF [Gammaproteobacteria bacterium]
MWFGAVAATNLRCFADIEYRPSPRINLIYGSNGAGKTSLLEAFSLASIGKSFLSNRTSDVVKTGSIGLSVRAVTNREKGGSSTVVVKKMKAETTITMDGMPVVAASVLARNAPVLVINSKAPDLLSDNPSNRRALIDRSLFHVKHSYVDTWKQYRQALRQRNEVVRTG